MALLDAAYWKISMTALYLVVDESKPVFWPDLVLKTASREHELLLWLIDLDKLEVCLAGR